MVRIADPNNLQAQRKLVADNEGNIFYVFLNLDLLTYNRRTNEFSAANNFFPIPLNWKIVSLVQDPQSKKYWIGTDSGMAVFNKQTKAVSYYGHNIDREPMIDALGKLGASHSTTSIANDAAGFTAGRSTLAHPACIAMILQRTKLC